MLLACFEQPPQALCSNPTRYFTICRELHILLTESYYNITTMAHACFLLVATMLVCLLVYYICTLRQEPFVASSKQLDAANVQTLIVTPASNTIPVTLYQLHPFTSNASQLSLVSFTANVMSNVELTTEFNITSCIDTCNTQTTFKTLSEPLDLTTRLSEYDQCGGSSGWCIGPDCQDAMFTNVAYCLKKAVLGTEVSAIFSVLFIEFFSQQRQAGPSR